MTAGKVPPHALEAEAAVISAVLLKAEKLDEFTLDPEDFYNPQNKLIFEAFRDLRVANQAIDTVTVATQLRQKNQLEAAGGAAYLAQVVDSTPAVAHVADHAQLVAGKAKLRRLIAECQTIAAEGYGDVGPVDAYLDEAEAKVCAIADQRTSSKGPVHALEPMRVAFQAIADAAEGKTEASPPIPTGLAPLDRALQLRRGRMSTLAAGTGLGKTTIALQFGLGASARGLGVLFISLEMPAPQLMQRAAFQLAGVDGGKIRNATRLTDAEWRRLSEASGSIGKSPFFVDDSEEATALSLRASVRRARAACRRAGKELVFVVVDYLQLLDGKQAGRDANREQQVSFISRRLKVLSRAENVHVLALAQLNDDATRENRRPSMRDLRESKAVAMHSDNVLVIHAPHAADRAEREAGNGYSEPEPEEVFLYIDKQRDGAPGRVPLTFYPGQTRFAAQGYR